MQAGLQVPYCCRPATYVNTTCMHGPNNVVMLQPSAFAMYQSICVCAFVPVVHFAMYSLPHHTAVMRKKGQIAGLVTHTTCKLGQHTKILTR
jgi:hypothetical protein